jgi:nitrous oxide reductase
MNKIIAGLIVILVLVGGYMYYKNKKIGVEVSNNTANASAVVENSASVKEFTMTSWLDKVDGQMKAHFSLAEIRVKKGDTVRINITNTAGVHNFVIDEFGIKKETPVNEPVVVEFVADKVGTFEYYCSKYNHRMIGQRGNLVVEE